jgi:hypothetical protein
VSRIKRSAFRGTASPATQCGVCRLTPLSHGILPVAGSMIAFVVLVFCSRYFAIVIN